MRATLARNMVMLARERAKRARRARLARAGTSGVLRRASGLHNLSTFECR